MTFNFKRNKYVSVILAAALLLTTVLLPLMTVFSLEDEAWAIQLSREGDANGKKINYSNYNWSSLGSNLIPDPTVSHFDVDGKYGS